MSDSEKRPVLLALDMADPIASVRDPAFFALIERGYTVTAHTAAQRGERQEWLLLLEPSQPTGLSTHHSVTISAKERAVFLVVLAAHAALTALLAHALGA